MKPLTDTITIRGLSEYEIEKWFDNGYFNMDGEEELFLMYGDELGEAFDAAVTCCNMGDYGLSNEFERAAQIQVLDMYYNQLFLYTGEMVATTLLTV